VDGWFSVRCILTVGRPTEAAGDTYEERITLWRAASIEDAVALAEAEGTDYAAGIEEAPSSYLGFSQAFRLFDQPGHGAEIFSLMRKSELAPEDNIDLHFSTGQEREGEAV
jgi:hypothetical protein